MRLEAAYDRNGIPARVVHLGVGGFHRAHQADDLAAGRPPYEDAGVQLVDDVEPYRRPGPLRRPRG